MMHSDRNKCAAGNTGTEPYVAGYNMIRAHAMAAALYIDKYQATQKGQVKCVEMWQYLM